MKNKFIKSTIILMIGTCLSKILGFFIRIILTRTIQDGYYLYALILPTYSLLITITQLSLPYAISVIISRKKYKSLEVITSIVPISLLFNIFIITLVLLTAPYLSNTLLKNPNTYYPIISICFVLPFTTISGIIKGYYFGKQNMLPNSISSIFEQITRLLLLITIIPFLYKISIIYAVSGYIIISSISELIQIIIYLFFLPKKININTSNLKINKLINKDILSISIPNVTKGLIGNICYFLEPIILTNILLLIGYSNNYILEQYGIYNAYVIPMLTMPSFFTMSLNTCLIPEISKNYNNKNIIKKTLSKCLIISFLIGILFCSFVFIHCKLLLSLIYNTTKGISYIKLLCFIFPLFYLEGPLISTLQALNYNKYSLLVTLISCIIKLIILTIISLLKVGIYGLIISEIINIILVLILSYIKLKNNNYI